VKKIWQLLPVRFRDFAHLILHRINSSSVLLKILSFRHRLTRRFLAKQTSLIKLRLGESRYFQGWLSTNYQVFTRHYLDATKSYSQEFCQYIFADNVIEHLDKEKGFLFLDRAFEALCSGGVIRITTPDLEQITKKYLDRDLKALNDFQNDLANHRLDIQEFPDLLRITFTAFGHHKGFIYDKATLKARLEKIGFVNVSFHLPGQSDRIEVRGLESRIGTSDMWSQMAIEAEKP
jgi:predicted SAM-dependent methyltransferase